jgi:hypothetical protein
MVPDDLQGRGMDMAHEYAAQIGHLLEGSMPAVHRQLHAQL